MKNLAENRKVLQNTTRPNQYFTGGRGRKTGWTPGSNIRKDKDGLDEIDFFFEDESGADNINSIKSDIQMGPNAPPPSTPGNPINPAYSAVSNTRSYVSQSNSQISRTFASRPLVARTPPAAKESKDMNQSLIDQENDIHLYSADRPIRVNQQKLNKASPPPKNERTPKQSTAGPTSGSKLRHYFTDKMQEQHSEPESEADADIRKTWRNNITQEALSKDTLNNQDGKEQSAPRSGVVEAISDSDSDADLRKRFHKATKPKKPIAHKTIFAAKNSAIPKQSAVESQPLNQVKAKKRSPIAKTVSQSVIEAEPQIPLNNGNIPSPQAVKTQISSLIESERNTEVDQNVNMSSENTLSQDYHVLDPNFNQESCFKDADLSNYADREYEVPIEDLYKVQEVQDYGDTDAPHYANDSVLDSAADISNRDQDDSGPDEGIDQHGDFNRTNRVMVSDSSEEASDRENEPKNPIPSPKSNPRTVQKKKKAVKAVKVHTKSDPHSYSHSNTVIIPVEHEQSVAQDDGGTRRSKRNRIAPLAYWRNEKAIFDRRQSGLSITNVVRVREDNGTQKKRKATTSKTKKSKKVVSRYQESEEDVTESVFSDDADSDALEVKTYSKQKKAPKVQVPLPPASVPVINYITKEEDRMRIAVIPSMLETNRTTGGGDYKFTRVFGEGAFASGILELPVGGNKPDKSSQGSEMVFIVECGLVEVTVHTTTFRLSDGGQFFVPRGNHYSITNVGPREAKLYFCHSKK